MSTTFPIEPAEAPPSSRTFTWHGVRTVLRLELRQRVRSTRWKIALVGWFVVVGAISLLLPSLVSSGGDGAGSWVYGLILMLVLGLGLVVSPTMSSTAINGDRNAGTLAILQVTMLGPAEIAVGKLLAGWAAALAFLAVSLPFLIWGAVISRVDPLGWLLSMVVLALLLGVVCAIGLGFSSLTTRPAGSSVLTYVAVVSLTVLSLIVFLVSIPAVTTRDEVEMLVVPADANATCEWITQPQDVLHTERTWWLLAINPFVVLADASPGSASTDDWGYGPLTAIKEGVRYARTGEGDAVENQCYTENYPAGYVPQDRVLDDSPVWPWGLGANLLLGAGGLALAIRRLAVPYTTLSPGTRVA